MTVRGPGMVFEILQCKQDAHADGHHYGMVSQLDLYVHWHD